MERTYSIEEAAHRCGVSTHTLRYYERIGLLSRVGRANSGHRRYRDNDLGSVTFLTMLRQTGMPIRDMLTFVELTRAGDHNIGERVEVLEAHRDALAAQLELLGRHFSAIEHKIDVYRGLLRAATDSETSAVGREPALTGTETEMSQYA